MGRETVSAVLTVVEVGADPESGEPRVVLTGSEGEVRKLGPLLYAKGVVFHADVSRETGPWPGEVCKRCDRPNRIGFSVADEVWQEVVRGRWNVLCPQCFDDEASEAGVAYVFGALYPVTWSMWEAGQSSAEPPSLDRPCPHPDRNGKHETYTTGKECFCRACGARKPQPWP